MNVLDQIMGVQEAAELWGLSADRVKGMCQRGEAKAKKIGNSWVLDRNQTNPKKYRIGVNEMRTWKRDGYEVNEVEFDYDLHEFKVVKDDGEVIATITPQDVDDMEMMAEMLDNGEGLDGWEDGMGNTISI